VWLLIAAAAAAVIGGIVFLVGRRNKRNALAEWSVAAGRAVQEGKTIVDELMTGGQDIEPVMQRRLQGLDAQLAALQTSAPSPAHEQQVGQTRAVATELGTAVQNDLRVRIGPPAPTDEQLEASRAVIEQRTRDLNGALDRLTASTQPPSPA
jgi:hypothetical protein